jgi:hypothetical protein
MVPFRTMGDGSDDSGASDDDDGGSQEETPFEEVLHEMLAIITRGRYHYRSGRIHSGGISGTFYHS